MTRMPPRLATVPLVMLALAVGWMFGNGRGTVEAGGGTRAGASAAIAGPVRVESGGSARFGMGRIQAALDAVYWIDYRAARLFAAIPSAKKTAADSRLLRGAAERDLIDDFGLRPGVQPRFLMQTAQLGALAGGASFLVVVEATTRQIAVYQAQPRAEAADGRPQFDRLQLAPYGGTTPPPAPGPRGEPVGVAGPVLIQQAPDGGQAALDAVYWLDSDRDTTLRAVVPSMQRRAGEARVLGTIGERDLAADFGLRPGSAPQFLLSPVSLGAATQGAAVLTVVETTTRQVAAYRVPPDSAAGGADRADIELVQVRPYVEPPAGPATTSR